MEYLKYFQYNSFVILTFFFISLLVLFINHISKGKSNKLLFSCYQSSMFNPLTYLRFFTHILGHKDWNHFISNFLYILLIGPMIEEKYGSLNLLYMILITALVTGIVHFLFSKKRILGASGIVYMLIVLSSFVNFEAGKIPITLILICMFYVIGEIRDGIFKKKDGIGHFAHFLGAVCGCAFGFYFMKYKKIFLPIKILFK